MSSDDYNPNPNPPNGLPADLTLTAYRPNVSQFFNSDMENDSQECQNELIQHHLVVQLLRALQRDVRALIHQMTQLADLILSDDVQSCAEELWGLLGPVRN